MGCWYAVNGNPTILDMGRLPFLLQIGNGSSLELRDLLIRNYAKPSAAVGSYEYNCVSGMLSWPTFTAQPGANLKLANTTQYFWSSTLFHQLDCPLQINASAFRIEEQVDALPSGMG